MREVSLLQDDHDVPYVLSPEIHPHRRPCPGPYQASFYWTLLCPPPLGNSIRYVFGSPPPPPPVAASVHVYDLSLAFPCCDMRCESSDPAATSFPQSLHSARSLFLSLNVSPSPVILRPYASSDWFPAAVHGLQVMLTVFPVFVFSPTQSNNPTSVVNAHCSQRGSDDANMPSSA